MSERSLGDKWAARERARGAFVLKLPAFVTSGIPDWLHVVSGEGIGLVEAKLAQGPRALAAYNPVQLTGAQHFTLRMVGRHGGRAQVLVLAPEGFVVLDWQELDVPLSWRQWFDRMEEF